MAPTPWPFPIWKDGAMVKHKFAREPKPVAPELPLAPF